MQRIYVDECGYTGEDLLNEEQPFQAVSSVQITEEEAAELITRHFPRRQSPELKHKQLAKRATYWKALGDIQEELYQNFSCHSYIVDKRFMLIQKFVANCVEPFYHSVGIDFYEDGQSESTASLLQRCGPALFGKLKFETFLQLYQKVVRKKNESDIKELVRIASELMKTDLKEILGPLGSGYPQATEELRIEGVNLDLAYPLVLGIVSLAERQNTSYEIVHDQSENLKSYGQSFQSMIDTEQIQSFRFSQVSKLDFPLKLKSVSQIDSKDSPAVQLADILVGGIVAFTQAITTHPERKNQYTQRLEEIYDASSQDTIVFQMPSLDFEETKKRRSGNESADFIDFAAKHLK